MRALLASLALSLVTACESGASNVCRGVPPPDRPDTLVTFHCDSTASGDDLTIDVEQPTDRGPVVVSIHRTRPAPLDREFCAIAYWSGHKWNIDDVGGLMRLTTSGPDHMFDGVEIYRDAAHTDTLLATRDFLCNAMPPP